MEYQDEGDDIFRDRDDGGDGDDGDGDGGDDYEYQAERAAVERTGKRQSLGDFVNVFADMKDKKQELLQRRLLLEGMSDEERFTRSVGIYAKTIFADHIGEIRGQEQKKIETMISKLQHIKYKNPLAFLLAYYVLKKEKEKEKIDRDKMKLFIKICKDNAIEITKEDIIRYFRLLQNL